MKEIVMYKCDKCGRVFEDKESCKQCENNHFVLQDFELVSIDCEYGCLMPTYIYVKNKKTNREYPYHLA